MTINEIFQVVNEYYVINKFNKKNFIAICSRFGVVPDAEEIEMNFETGGDQISLFIYGKKR